MKTKTGNRMTTLADLNIGTPKTVLNLMAVPLAGRTERKRIDNNGISECQKYEYTRDPWGRVFTFRKNKSTVWGMKFKSIRKLAGSTKPVVMDYELVIAKSITTLASRRKK